MVLARSVTFPFSFYVRLSLPSLCVPAPPLSLPRLRILYMCALRRPLLVPSGLGRNVGTLPQTLAGHAGKIGLAALASRGLAC